MKRILGSRTNTILAIVFASSALPACKEAIESSEQVKRLEKKAQEAAKDVKAAAKVAGELADDVGEVAAVAVDVAKAVKELNPVSIERSQKDAEVRWKEGLGVVVPQGYRGALVATFALPGDAAIELTSVIPKRANVALVFVPKKAALKLSPGKHTVFVGAHLPGGDPRLLRLAMSALSDDGDAPFTLGSMTVKTKKIAFYEQVLERDRALFFFLEGGHVLHAVGPKKGFDDAAVKGVVAALVSAHPKDRFLASLPAP
jgi:enamine deaminase RidA (YjgF/YER057c/UK114 family)